MTPEIHLAMRFGLGDGAAKSQSVGCPFLLAGSASDGILDWDGIRSLALPANKTEISEEILKKNGQMYPIGLSVSPAL